MTQKALHLISLKMHTPFLLWRAIKKYLEWIIANHNQFKYIPNIYYFKLQYINKMLDHIKMKLSKLCKKVYKVKFNIKLVFTSFKIIFIFFWHKGPIPADFKF